MQREAQDIEAPGGPLRLRLAEPADAGFQYALFAANRAGVLRLAGLPEPMVETLLRQQYRGRAESYRAGFPAAVWFLVERGGEPIGELILAEADDVLHIVDIALHPESQGQRIAPALLRAVMQDSAGVSARADVGNVRSRRMFARLGFAERAGGDAANVELRWRPRPPE